MEPEFLSDVGWFHFLRGTECRSLTKRQSHGNVVKTSTLRSCCYDVFWHTCKLACLLFGCSSFVPPQNVHPLRCPRNFAALRTAKDMLMTKVTAALLAPVNAWFNGMTVHLRAYEVPASI